MSRISFYTKKINSLYGPMKALRFFVLANLYRKSFANWLNFIEKSPVNTSEELTTILAMSVAFRFVDPQFTVPQRIKTLIYHYAMLANRLSRPALTAFMTGKAYQVAEMTGQSGNKYVLRMINKVARDGAMQIVFTDVETNADLAVLGGIIGEAVHEGGPIFGISMLIGPGLRLPNSKQRIADATRDLNGLSPKQVTVHAAAAFTQWFGIPEMITPGEKKVGLKNWSKRRAIQADHDAFWLGFTKGRALDGCYRMPVPLARLTPAEVPPEQRKDWDLRYSNIDAADAEIKNMLDKLIK